MPPLRSLKKNTNCNWGKREEGISSMKKEIQSLPSPNTGFGNANKKNEPHQRYFKKKKNHLVIQSWKWGGITFNREQGQNSWIGQTAKRPKTREKGKGVTSQKRNASKADKK